MRGGERDKKKYTKQEERSEESSEPKRASLRLLPRIGLVHERDFPRDTCPFKFSSQRLVSLTLLELIPFQEFVSRVQCQLSCTLVDTEMEDPV